MKEKIRIIISKIVWHPLSMIYMVIIPAAVITFFIMKVVVWLFFTTEPHHCHEKEYKEAYLNCMKDREKVREILKGDSLNCLLRSPHDGAVIYW